MCPKCKSRKRTSPGVMFKEMPVIPGKLRKYDPAKPFADQVDWACIWGRKVFEVFYCMGCGYELGRYG